MWPFDLLKRKQEPKEPQPRGDVVRRDLEGPCTWEVSFEFEAHRVVDSVGVKPPAMRVESVSILREGLPSQTIGIVASPPSSQDEVSLYQLPMSVHLYPGETLSVKAQLAEPWKGKAGMALIALMP